jgi:hypothetical protein
VGKFLTLPPLQLGLSILRHRPCWYPSIYDVSLYSSAIIRMTVEPNRVISPSIMYKYMGKKVRKKSGSFLPNHCHSYSKKEILSKQDCLDSAHAPSHLIFHAPPILLAELDTTHRTKTHDGNESNTPSSSDDKSDWDECEIGPWEDERYCCGG